MNPLTKNGENMRWTMMPVVFHSESPSIFICFVDK